MNMSVAKLKKWDACKDGIQYFKDHKFTSVEQAITEILKTDHAKRYEWSSWLFSKTLNKENRVRYAIYAAKLVLPIWEKEFPKDKRPHEAVNAAKAWINDPSEVNTEKCKQAAAATWSAARSAANDAAADAAEAAACAADAAGYAAAWAAAAARAAGKATDAAANDAAAAAYLVGDEKIPEKIIRYGLKLLKTKQ